MLKVIAFFVGIIAITTGICAVQAEPDVPIAEKIVAIRQWVLHGQSKAGKATVGSDAAKLLGMGQSDLIGTQANFGGKAGGVGIFFVTLPSRPDILLIRLDYKIDRRVYWRVKRDGTLLRTVQRQNGELTVVSGEDYDRGAVGILNYFYRNIGQNLVASK